MTEGGPEMSDRFDLDTIDRLVEAARSMKPPIRPGVGPDGREYYFMATNDEQAGNVIRGEVIGLPQPSHIEADVQEDGSWSVWVIGEDGSMLLCCHPENYCELAGCTMEELRAMVGLK